MTKAHPNRQHRCARPLPFGRIVGSLWRCPDRECKQRWILERVFVDGHPTIRAEWNRF